MQPNGSSPPDYPAPAAPPNNNPYDFLNQPAKTSSPLKSLIGGSSLKKRLLIILAVVFIIVILLAALKSILSSNAGVNMTSMYAVLSSQQEINALALAGTHSASSQSYLNFSYTALATTFTDETALSQLLTSNGFKIKPTLIVTEPALSTQLTQAQQLSDFDSVYGPLLSSQLNNYRVVLVNAYKLNKSPVIKNILNVDYKNAGLLITMLNSSYG